MSAHTPGPWAAWDRVPGVLAPIVRSGGITVADVWVGQTPDIASADARLIAAAPEMLDALRVVMEAIDALEIDGSEGLPANNWHWFNHARALIAKVEGQG